MPCGEEVLDSTAGASKDGFWIERPVLQLPVSHQLEHTVDLIAAHIMGSPVVDGANQQPNTGSQLLRSLDGMAVAAPPRLVASV